jgi:hypothetical protein
VPILVRSQVTQQLDLEPKTQRGILAPQILVALLLKQNMRAGLIILAELAEDLVSLEKAGDLLSQVRELVADALQGWGHGWPASAR